MKRVTMATRPIKTTFAGVRSLLLNMASGAYSQAGDMPNLLSPNFTAAMKRSEMMPMVITLTGLSEIMNGGS
jgi:hypothetical protein